MGKKAVVVVRVLPSDSPCARVVPPASVAIARPRSSMSKSFGFDAVYDPALLSDHDAFAAHVQSAVAHAVRPGENCCLVTFGAPGTGKTTAVSSFWAPIARLVFGGGVEGAQKGVCVSVVGVDTGTEAVEDLLAPQPVVRTRMRQDTRQDMFFVEDLVSVSVHSAQEMETLFALAQRRAPAAHRLFTVSITQEHDDGSRTSSQLWVLDLKGFDRKAAAKSAMASGQDKTMKGFLRVVDAASAPRPSHVPFRDAKVTRLVQSAFGGNCHTVFLACVKSDTNSHDETQAVLMYAEKFGRIVTQPTPTVQNPKQRIAELSKSVEELCDQVGKRVSHSRELELGMEASDSEVKLREVLVEREYFEQVLAFDASNQHLDIKRELLAKAAP